MAGAGNVMMPVDRSTKSKFYKQIGSVGATTYEKSSGNVYMSFSITKKIVDGEEKTVFSMHPDGSPCVEFSDETKFLAALKEVVMAKANSL